MRSILLTSAAIAFGGIALIGCTAESPDSATTYGTGTNNSSAQQANYDRAPSNSQQPSGSSNSVQVNPPPSQNTPYQKQNSAYNPNDTTKFHPETDYGHSQTVTTPNGDSQQRFQPGPANQQQNPEQNPQQQTPQQ